MRFLPALAILVVIAVALQSLPSVVDAETLPEPARAVQKKPVPRGPATTTTLSPKDFFLKHAKPTGGKGRKAKPSVVVTTTVASGKSKPKSKAVKPKGKGGRKSRAHCTQCTPTTVVTHMEKKSNDTPTQVVDDKQAVVLTHTVPHHNAPSAPLNQFYFGDMEDMEMGANAPIKAIAPLDKVQGATTLLANGTLKQVLTKADLIALDTVNATIDNHNIFP